MNGLKIIHISDLHLGSFTSTKPIKDVVKLINNEEADIIVFTGDIINNSYWEAEDFIDDLSQLNAKYGKYAVLGNHDYGDYLGIDKKTESGMNEWQSNFNKMTSIYHNIGFDLLLNENRTIKILDSDQLFGKWNDFIFNANWTNNEKKGYFKFKQNIPSILKEIF